MTYFIKQITSRKDGTFNSIEDIGPQLFKQQKNPISFSFLGSKDTEYTFQVFKRENQYILLVNKEEFKLWTRFTDSAKELGIRTNIYLFMKKLWFKEIKEAVQIEDLTLFDLDLEVAESTLIFKDFAHIKDVRDMREIEGKILWKIRRTEVHQLFISPKASLERWVQDIFSHSKVPNKVSHVYDPFCEINLGKGVKLAVTLHFDIAFIPKKKTEVKTRVTCLLQTRATKEGIYYLNEENNYKKYTPSNPNMYQDTIEEVVGVRLESFFRDIIVKEQQRLAEIKSMEDSLIII